MGSSQRGDKSSLKAPKRKRTRKAKSRTTAVSQESESDDSAASNAEVKSKGHSKQKVAVISGEKEKRAEQISSKDNSSPPNETHEDQKFIKRKDLPTDNARDAQSPTVEAKRKRKRKRHNEKKVEESVDIQPLADPHADNRISEKMASALCYAQQFNLDRSNWKFNKAKQELLIRHMLTPPVDTRNEDDNAEGIQTHSFWLDEWTPCVAKYLATVQGSAKERLIQKLQTAAQTPEEESSNEDHLGESVAGTNFGKIAMQENNAEMKLGYGKFVRTRASSLLELMGEI